MARILAVLAAASLSACATTISPLGGDAAAGAGPDAGAASSLDAGTPRVDAGTLSVDAGAVVAADAGAHPTDGGEATLPFEGGSAVYARWPHGPPSTPDFFPITVWLQSPGNAARYQAIGINTFVGLWDGPTDQQLTDLTGAQMPVLCAQDVDWSKHLSDPIVEGWTQEDEPDNAQSDGSGGYLPCVDPATIVQLYQTMTAADPSRPVFLNFGQGVSYDSYIGRGTCTGKLDMYAQYLAGGDIISFDIYPVNSTYPDVQGKLWMVPQGVDRLRQWAGYQKPVWNWIETTGIDDPSGKPTPAQVKAEVWMSLVHGSLGIGYFAHVMGPTFDETGLLDDAQMSAAVKDIDAQITALAPALNTPSLAQAVTVASSNAAVPVDFAAKRAGGALYVFAVAMRPGATTASFTLQGVGDASAEVLGESRTAAVSAGVLQDDFAADYAVHLYRVP